MCKILKLFGFFLLAFQSYCDAQVAMQNVVPPSPRASAFHIYGDYPVSYSRGLADISIPIYTIDIDGKKFPITLRYHHSGIKFYETEESNVATGWQIDYGGLISVTRLGKRDEYNAYSNVRIGPYSELVREDFDTLQRVYNNLNLASELDGQYDIYNYDFCGKSGRFLRDKNGKVVKFPYNSIDFKFSFSTSNLVHHIDSYDEDGIHYRFGSSIDDSTSAFESYGSNSSFSSMLLTDVELPEGKKIKYFYKESQGGNKLVPSHFAKVVDYRIGEIYNRPPTAEGSGFPITQPDESSCGAYPQQSMVTYNSKIISEIDFPNGKLVFISDASGLRVSEIDIYSSVKLIKKVFFNTTDFDGRQKRYALNSLEFKDIADNTESKYTFDYDSGRFPPALNINALDYWGYYNGQTGNTTLVPNFLIPFQYDVSHASFNRQIYTSPQNCNRQVSEPWMQVYILKKITYPTGGTTEFTYEANRYGVDNKLGGGLRISTIVSKDGNGGQTIKTYKYGNGILELNPETPENYLRGSRTWQQFTAVDGQGHCAPPVTYSYRVRYYGADMNSTLTLGGGNQIYYINVTEYNGTEAVNTGRTTYKYDYYSNGYHGYNRDGLFIPYLSDWINFQSGNLLEKTVEKKNDDGTWSIVTKTTNNYTFNPKDSVSGLIVDLIKEMPTTYHRPVSSSPCTTSPLYGGNYFNFDTFNLFKNTDNEFYIMPDKNLFYTYFYTIHTGYNTLTTTTSVLNSSSGPVTSKTDYTYDLPDFLQPTKETIFTSKGDAIEKRNKYVPSAEYVSTAPYNYLLQKNIISPLLEQKTYRINGGTEKLISTTNTSYKQFFTNVIKPEKSETYFSTNANDKLAISNDYDNTGNLIGQARPSGPNVGYQWGYNKQYPVAQATNATNAQIFYEGFEDSTASGVVTGTGHTGSKYSTGNTVNWTRPDSRNYVISYWYLSGGSWLYKQEQAYTGSSFTLTGGTAYDDIRIYPKDAQVTTYTYDPLVGMTSMTDAKGETTYYEYDSFQRLVNVKDKDGNIINHTDYHYQTQ